MVENKPTEVAKKASTKRDTAKTAPKSQPREVVLLSGGNPQIAKGYWDAPASDGVRSCNIEM